MSCQGDLRILKIHGRLNCVTSAVKNRKALSLYKYNIPIEVSADISVAVRQLQFTPLDHITFVVLPSYSGMQDSPILNGLQYGWPNQHFHKYCAPKVLEEEGQIFIIEPRSIVCYLVQCQKLTGQAILYSLYSFLSFKLCLQYPVSAG